MRIGADLMGSDTDPYQLYQAVVDVAKEEPEYSFLALASHQIAGELESVKNIEIVSCAETIAMDEMPLTAVRRKKNSSLLAGVRLLGNKQLDAFVTAGNTGALIAGCALNLPLLSGINRPALLAVLPTEKKPVIVLDVGGNLSLKPHHMIQFAHLAAAYYQSTVNRGIPRAGLLNIGVEARKGTPELQEARDVLEKHCQRLGELGQGALLTFVGNIEAREVYQGEVDILLTDGFTGNIFLKASEGVSKFILEYLRQAFSYDMKPEVRDILQNLHLQVSYAEHPGAIVCGIDGVVVKCHGNACKLAMANGIRGALGLVKNGLISKMKENLAKSL